MRRGRRRRSSPSPARSARAAAPARLRPLVRPPAAARGPGRRALPGCGAGATEGAAGAPSMLRCGSHSSQLGRYQFQRPSSFMLAGTRIVRMSVASSSTATARPKPICWNITRSPAAKPAKTATMISAAPVMMPAVAPTPSVTGQRVVAGPVVVLLDAAEQEDLVVHREAEQHGEEEAAAPTARSPATCWKPSTPAPHPLSETSVTSAVGRADAEQVHEDRLDRDDDRAERDQRAAGSSGRGRSATTQREVAVHDVDVVERCRPSAPVT